MTFLLRAKMAFAAAGLVAVLALASVAAVVASAAAIPVGLSLTATMAAVTVLRTACWPQCSLQIRGDCKEGCTSGMLQAFDATPRGP